jgi:hypothetical protein
MKATCPYCAHRADHERLSGNRGPGQAWVRLLCGKCQEGFEFHVEHQTGVSVKPKRTREKELNTVVGEFIRMVDTDVICVAPRHRDALIRLLANARHVYKEK